jgi:hypothetical protein
MSTDGFDADLPRGVTATGNAKGAAMNPSDEVRERAYQAAEDWCYKVYAWRMNSPAFMDRQVAQLTTAIEQAIERVERAQPSAGAGMSEQRLREQLENTLLPQRAFVPRLMVAPMMPLIRTYCASREELASAAMLERCVHILEECTSGCRHFHIDSIRSLGSTNALAEALRRERIAELLILNADLQEAEVAGDQTVRIKHLRRDVQKRIRELETADSRRSP